MKKKLKFILQEMERIKENHVGQLQGGFVSVSQNSSSLNIGPRNINCPCTSNTKAKNCAPGCSQPI